MAELAISHDQKGEGPYLYKDGSWGPEKSKARKFFSIAAAAAQLKEMIGKMSVKDSIADHDWLRYYDTKRSEYIFVPVPA